MEISVMDTAPSASPLSPEPFEFTGTGSDYFRIWIVNIALTIVTLGIYSAWAKVRRLQYFYRNTSVAGGSFDYHGNPMAILKGRLIALAVLVVYNVAGGFSPLLALIVAIPIALVLPWMLRQSLRFRLHYSSWRGLRFAFRGDLRGAYTVFLMWPILTGLTLYLLGPMWHQRLKSYQHGNSTFGATPFSFSASVGSFYRPYVLAFLMLVGLVVAIALVGGGAFAFDRSATIFVMLALSAITFLIFTAVVGPYLTARVQNLVWNSTALGLHRFESRIEVGPLAWIVLSNLVLIVLTLGLFMPFAAVRLARYRVSCMTLLPGTPLDQFVTGEKAQVAALGEEMGELLDIDIAL
jgi:uncharacterized membrane protein YjgN (DUF898 family)